ncbi:hypothetical protein WG66_012672 [Moniliophthora roreri]|nr:hypothetical protein WG66_012672 [Moniliophthora roreri]
MPPTEPQFLPRLVPHLYDEYADGRSSRRLFVRTPSPLTRRSGDDNQYFTISGLLGPLSATPIHGRVIDADTLRAQAAAHRQSQGQLLPRYTFSKGNALVLVDITSILDYYSNLEYDAALSYKLARKIVSIILSALKERFSFPFTTKFVSNSCDA